MNEVSLFRLYVLRAMYLFIVVGLGFYVWPGALDPNKHWELMQGEVSCMLAAFSLLCLVGLRYPLQILALRVRALHQGAGGAVLSPGHHSPHELIE